MYLYIYIYTYVYTYMYTYTYVYIYIYIHTPFNLHERALGLEVGHEGLALQLVNQLVQVTVLYVQALTVFWP